MVHPWHTCHLQSSKVTLRNDLAELYFQSDSSGILSVENRYLQRPYSAKVEAEVKGLMQEFDTLQPGRRYWFSCPILAKFGTNDPLFKAILESFYLF